MDAAWPPAPCCPANATRTNSIRASLAVVELADLWRAYERDGLRTDEGIDIGPCVLRVLEG